MPQASISAPKITLWRCPKAATKSACAASARSLRGFHLHHVLTDITGESGLRVLDAILAGERQASKLAMLVDHRVKKNASQIEAALSGDYRQEQLFVIGQELASWRHEQEQIARCDNHDEIILAQLRKMDPRSATQTGGTSAMEASVNKSKKAKAPKNPQDGAVVEQLQRILGVDLTQIPGLGVLAVLTILSEIGANMNKWRNEKAFTSWLGLCPSNKISGGRLLSSRTRKVVCRTATVLRMAAMAIGKTDTPYGSFYRRKRAQLGAPKANTATARKLAALIYRLIKNADAYQPGDLRAYEAKFKNQMLNSLRKRAQNLGFQLVDLHAAA